MKKIRWRVGTYRWRGAWGGRGREPQTAPRRWSRARWWECSRDSRRDSRWSSPHRRTVQITRAAAPGRRPCRTRACGPESTSRRSDSPRLPQPPLCAAPPHSATPAGPRTTSHWATRTRPARRARAPDRPVATRLLRPCARIAGTATRKYSQYLRYAGGPPNPPLVALHD